MNRLVLKREPSVGAIMRIDSFVVSPEVSVNWVSSGQKFKHQDGSQYISLQVFVNNEVSKNHLMCFWTYHKQGAYGLSSKQLSKLVYDEWRHLWTYPPRRTSFTVSKVARQLKKAIVDQIELLRKNKHDVNKIQIVLPTPSMLPGGSADETKAR